ncbi:hypothetical protein HK405_013918 [Cladochytrium tenue]|nr:hypothetical protein HK405_013918 [Cladochytrium tenue]
MAHDLTTSDGNAENHGLIKEDAEELDPQLEVLLQTEATQGLTSAEAEARLQMFGRNEASSPAKKSHLLLKLLSSFSGGSGVGGASGAPSQVMCRRDGRLSFLDARLLVPGDVIVLRAGVMVPADCRLLGLDQNGEPDDGDGLLIDQTAGVPDAPPLLVRKFRGDRAFAGSAVEQGRAILAIVTKTGASIRVTRTARSGPLLGTLAFLNTAAALASVGWGAVALVRPWLLDPSPASRALALADGGAGGSRFFFVWMYAARTIPLGLLTAAVPLTLLPPPRSQPRSRPTGEVRRGAATSAAAAAIVLLAAVVQLADVGIAAATGNAGMMAGASFGAVVHALYGFALLGSS